MQWYDLLQTCVNDTVEDIIDECHAAIQIAAASEATFLPQDPLPHVPPETSQVPSQSQVPPQPPPPRVSTEPEPSRSPPPTRGECRRLLRERCPACFGGLVFGQSFNKYVYHFYVCAIVLTALGEVIFTLQQMGIFIIVISGALGMAHLSTIQNTSYQRSLWMTLGI